MGVQAKRDSINANLRTRSWRNWYFSIALFLQFVPREYVLGSLVYKAWQIIAMLIGIIATFVLLHSKRVTSRWTCFFLFLMVSFVLSSVVRLSFGNITSLIFDVVHLTGMASILELICYCCKKDSVKIIAIALVPICLIQFGSFLIYRDVVGGMQHNVFSELTNEVITQNYYFYTYDNESIFYLLPTLAVCLFLGVRDSKKWMLIFIFIASAYLVSYIYKHSVTAAITLLIFLAMLTLFRCAGSLNKSVNHLVRPKSFCIFGLLLCSVIPITVEMGMFNNLVALLGKSVTLSGRVPIWNKALDAIANHPLFGNGILTSNEAINMLGITHCHNLVVQILFTGGLISLSLFVLSLFKCFYSKANEELPDIIRYLLSATIFSFFVAASMDWLYSNPVYILVLYLPCLCRASSSEVEMA